MKGGYGLPGCGQYYLEITNDVVSGMISTEFMDKSKAWPTHNGKTMNLSEFRPLVSARTGYDYPCKIAFANDDKSELEKAYEEAVKSASDKFDVYTVRDAIRNGNLKLTEYLLDKYEVKNRPEFIDLALDAASYGRVELLEPFLNRGLPLDVTDKYEGSLLHSAGAYPDMVDHLLKRGVPTNLTNMWGTTSLMSVVNSGCVRSVKLMIDAGAPINTTNKEGKSAIHMAKKLDYDTRDEILSMLK
jgi:ankyrin repeat protein